MLPGCAACFAATIALGASLTSAQLALDIVIADFEGESYGNRTLEVLARGGTAKATVLEVYELKSAWE